MKHLRFLLLLVATSAFASQGMGPGPGVGHGSGGGGPTPQLIQLNHWHPNPAASGGPNGNAFQLNIAPTGSGDMVFLGLTGASGSALTITDSSGDASPTAICTADNGAGNGLSTIYGIIPTAGTTWFKATASGVFAQPFDAFIAEYNNISTATAQGSNCQHGVTATAGTVTPTAFTPTNNNATGGNLIISYTPLGLGTNLPNCNASNYTTAGIFNLLYGDTDDFINGNGYGFQSSAQYAVQTTAASTSATTAMPGETCSGGNGDAFNTLTAAFKIGTAGITNPSTIHVVRSVQLTSTNFGGPNLPTSYVIPTPTQGNLTVFMFETINGGGYNDSPTSVVRSDGCTYHAVAATTANANAWYAQGCSPCPACTTTFSSAGGVPFANTVGRWYDVENADATSSYQNQNNTSLSCSSVTTIAHSPDFTPANTAGMAIGMLGNGQGPTKALTSPAGAYQCPIYTNQSDNDAMCSGDGHAYFAYSSNTTQNWTWTITSNVSNTCNATVLGFK